MSDHKPCCDACGGTGTASEQGMSGRCWDCYGTGCAHPTECEHDWEPYDLPDPNSAGAVIQCGHVCRACGLEDL